MQLFFINLLWKDDSLIASICARKEYSENPRTEFTITQLNEKETNGKEKGKTY